MYEVLWMKELGLAFGNTAHAAAATLVVFFLGLVASVAVSALLYFMLLDGYHAIYSPLFLAVDHQPALFLTVKFSLAAGVLFLPSFFTGGTLPMMSQHLVLRANMLGRKASLLYAVNALGAAAGAYAAGFHLPRYFGFTNSYLVAIAVTVLLDRLAASGHVVLGGRFDDAVAPSVEQTPARLPFKDILLRYSGNLTAGWRLVERHPVNTDDRPVIEYQAPITHRRNRADETAWFVGRNLVEFFRQSHARSTA